MACPNFKNGPKKGLGPLGSNHLLLSQFHYNFVEIYVIISRVIRILTSEFLSAEIGLKIFSDIPVIKV
jgi:hypothetical protein